MGDRCWMEVTCRAEDAPTFVDLGFVIQEYNDPYRGVAYLIDEEANYAHEGNMPGNIPYIGTFSPGASYLSGIFACNGKEAAESIQWGGQLLVPAKWDGTIPRQSMTNLQSFIRIHEEAMDILRTLEEAT